MAKLAAGQNGLLKPDAKKLINAFPDLVMAKKSAAGDPKKPSKNPEALLDRYEGLADRGRFVLVDGHAVIYRAYHAFPPLTNPEGMLVNAVYGFSRILLAAISQFEPRYIAVAFDHKAPTKRAEAFEAYKANRPAMPDDLQPQVGVIKDIVKALSIPQFEEAGYEADDLIGTVAARLSAECNPTDSGELLTTIVTGDKDLLQLVDQDTHVFIPGRGRFSRDIEYDIQTVEEKMGVRPDQIVDLKALMGDSSDNIPGVKGVGSKTAVKLIQEFENLDKLYEAVEADGRPDILKGALLTKLQSGKELAYLSRQLAKIDNDVPVDFELERCSVTDYDKTKVVELFKAHDFNSLISLLPQDRFEQGVQDALF